MGVPTVGWFSSGAELDVIRPFASLRKVLCDALDHVRGGPAADGTPRACRVEPSHRPDLHVASRPSRIRTGGHRRCGCDRSGETFATASRPARRADRCAPSRVRLAARSPPAAPAQPLAPRPAASAGCSSAAARQSAEPIATVVPVEHPAAPTVSAEAAEAVVRRTRPVQAPAARPDEEPPRPSRPRRRTVRARTCSAHLGEDRCRPGGERTDGNGRSARLCRAFGCIAAELGERRRPDARRRWRSRSRRARATATA